ncbi:MAG: hypothetical protein FIA91_00565 [Geobacter sp.]|nr:hypothetical protein [Geobacter sp.]
MLPDRVRDYLKRRAMPGPWQIEGLTAASLRGGIIIPSLAESVSIPLLLESLCADSTLPHSGLAVLLVVNNRLDATAEEQADNRLTLELVRSERSKLPFPLLLIDAATDGLALPLRDGGVGVARKLGHDLLLPRLDFNCCDPLLISLDADTTVAPGYAGAIVSHFAEAGCGGAVIPYSHRPGVTAAENLAIERYELFLRCYVAGLQYAGSPYAFHTVGSAMACRASAYVSCGGMNRRRAGEDFYFLQSLAKTSGVAQVSGTKVFPSPRRSGRGPFGTGRAVGALLDGDPEAVLFYQPYCFVLLRQWLQLAEAGCRERWPDLAQRSRQVAPVLLAFLEGQGFPLAWERLLEHNKSVERLCKGFHDWFDAFRTMKLLHLLSDELYPRGEPAELLDSLAELWGG